VGSAVVIRKRTSGTEADRILHELHERLHVAVDGASSEALHFSFDDDYAIARAEVEQTLNEISDTWPIHVGIDGSSDPG
jgi:hypothetical protein